MGVFFVKKSGNGAFCKKVDLNSTQGALCTVSVFFILHFTYLGECVRTQRTRAYLRAWSVCPMVRQPLQRAAGLMPSVPRAGHTD